jgi:ABC-2 type transport system permease protein
MSASVAVLKSEARLLRRELGGLFWMVGFPSLLVTILDLIPSFRVVEDAFGGRRLIDLYVPVAVLSAIIVTGAQVMPPVITGYRERGILRRMSVTPIRPLSVLTAQIVLHAAAALGSAVLVLTVGRLAYKVALPGQLLGYVVALLLAILSALALGATISAVSRTTKISSAIGSIVFFPMMFTAGVWAPVQVMPDTLQRIVQLTPFGAASQALDQAAAGHWPDWSHLGVTALWAAALVGVAARWFKWE